MKLKKLFSISLVVATVLNAKVISNDSNYSNLEFCNLESKKIIEKKTDAFGNVKKVNTNQLKKLAYKLYNNRSLKTSKIKIIKFWAEILKLNNEKFFSYDKQDKTIDFIIFTETTVPILVRKSELPATLNIQKLNIQLKDFKINSTLNMFSIASSLFDYVYVVDNYNLARNRLLILLAFLTSKNHPVIPLHCRTYGVSRIPEVSKQILIRLAILILEKDIDTIKLISLLINHKYDEVDKFLLSKKEVRYLFDVAKKHFNEIKIK